MAALVSSDRISSHIVEALHSTDIIKQTLAVRQLRKMVSTLADSPIDEILKSGILNKVAKFLREENTSELKLEAAWVLTNVASGSSHQTMAVIGTGAVPDLVRLLDVSDDDVRQMATWGLGNIAADCEECRDFVLSTGAMVPLLQYLLNEKNTVALRRAVWALETFCYQGDHAPKFSEVSLSLPVLSRLLCSNDDVVLIYTCKSLLHLSRGSNKNIQAVVNAGICRRLVELLRHDNSEVCESALGAAGNIVAGDNDQTQLVMDCNPLPILLDLLSSPEEKIRNATCWMIGNIVAGTEEQIQAVIDADFLPVIVNILRGNVPGSRKEAAWIVLNIVTCGSVKHLEFAVEHGCIQGLCELLQVSDEGILCVALDGLDQILRFGEIDADYYDLENVYAVAVKDCSGVGRIEALTEHKVEQVSSRAIQMILDYF